MYFKYKIQICILNPEPEEEPPVPRAGGLTCYVWKFFSSFFLILFKNICEDICALWNLPVALLLI